MKSGFKQSQLIIHYKGLGFGYGNINHWWGRGFHSAIALTSNASSQETYSVGTFKDIRFRKLSFGLKMLDNRGLLFISGSLPKNDNTTSSV